MTATQPSSRVPAWRVAVIGLVGALAVGIGVALGSFLLETRTAPIGSGASYVPATAPMYFEVRLEPSEAQDASLRELLGRFPAIEGLDLERPLYEQLTELVDQAAADEGAGVSWSGEVATWFDGRVGLAILDIPAEAFAPTDPMAAPPVPSMVGMLGVTDRVEAEAALGRLRAEGGEGLTFSQQLHGDVAIQVAGEDFAYALTDDQLLLAPAAGDIVAALDAHASSDTTLSEAGSITRLTEALPADWLAFTIYDFTEVMAAAFDSAAASASPGVDAMRELFANQPLRGAMAVTAAGDRVAIDVASDPPTGPLAVANADRGLAAQVPGDVLYYAEGGNVGASLSALIGPMKESVAAMPEAAEQLDMVEAALGGDVEELVEWMGDAATVVGWDGEQVWAGLIVVPTDAAAARRTMDKLETFANLAALDPSIGLALEQRDVEGTDVTSLRWREPNAPTEPDPMAPDMPFATPEIVVEWTVGDDRVLIGLGDRFVERILGQDAAGSLAEQPRYRDAVADLGGPSSTGVTWLDLRGVREALEATVGAGGDDSMMDAYAAEVLPWLEPLDRLVGVSRLDGEVLVSSLVLLVE